MFYSEYVFAKEGALGKFWLAAHWSKRLSRRQIADADVVHACDSIAQPKVKLALRTSGHLLLGVVNIHKEKQKTLLFDCTEAFTSIQLVFQPGKVDLPENFQAAVSNITLQEDIRDDFDLMDVDADGFFQEEATELFTAKRVEDIQLAKPVHSMLSSQQPMIDFDDTEFMPMPELGRDSDMMPEVGRDDAAASADVSTLGVAEAAAVNESKLDEQVQDQPSMTMDVTDPFMTMDEQPFGNDTMDMGELAGADQTTVEPVVEEFPQVQLDELAPTAKKPKLRVTRRNKKLIVDAETDIASDVMRAQLQPSGANDLVQRPFTEDFLEEPVPFLRARVRLQLASLEAAENAYPSCYLFATNPLLRSLVPSKLKWAKRSPAQAKAAAATDDEEGAAPSSKRALLDTTDITTDFDAQPDVQDIQQDFGYDMTMDDMNQTTTSRFDETAEVQQEDLREDGAAAATAVDDADAVPHENDTLADLSSYASESRATTQSDETSSVTPRTRKMMDMLRVAFQKEDTWSFNQGTETSTRSTAAVALLEVLTMTTEGFVNVDQAEPFDDIVVTPTDRLVSQS
eukprot:m.7342 g.7342  ORF g.7342 m.7342 type:complete len:570 (-) comp5237_c0_seq1:255-1964(-)